MNEAPAPARPITPAPRQREGTGTACPAWRMRGRRGVRVLISGVYERALGPAGTPVARTIATMSTSFIVLSEVPVSTSDAMTALRYLGLDPAEQEEADAASPDAPAVRVLVPRDAHRSLVAEVIDALGLIDLRGAWEAVAVRARHERAEHAARHAQEALEATTASFRKVGCTVEGTLCDGDPLEAVQGLLDDCSSQAVVVFSDPQLFEETFAQDWAHRVEDHLHATVLHLYPGSTMIGGS